MMSLAIADRITPEDQAYCEGDISLQEIEMAIKRLNRNKSLGINSLPGKFYLTFRELLTPLLLRLFVYMENSGKVAGNFLTGMITLIYQNKGDEEGLENNRPLSLLYTDY